jgi:hypothetical protein
MEKQQIKKYLQQQKENLVFVQSRLDYQQTPEWEHEWNTADYTPMVYTKVDLILIQEKIDKATEFLNKQ